MPGLKRILSALLCVFLIPSPSLAQKEHGFDNTKPSGQPYLDPLESLRRMKAPPGFEVNLFAAEPDIINPIAFSIDERGRVWVVECYEYPNKTPKGQKPRDRIKILEDTTGSGKADKVTVWASGKDLPIGWDLATGLEVGYGGVFLGAAPYLFFLSDSTGQGKCDKQEVLLSGFGSQDTHETLNTLQWGPEGLLYGLHGIFTQSKVGEVRLNAAVWRYNFPAKKFDIFAEGTSNPWGLDFDAHGQAFLTACVIPHAFHMIPGGTYIRQDGRPDSYNHPYSYGLLKEICDHTHHAESGWAHAGAMVLQGDQIPAEHQGSLLMGSIHGTVIKRDILERRGSTFVAKHAPDFLQCGDKNFRPINLRWGPDGSIYVIDWHDQNPCHQADPNSWDMTHGRIYKIRPTGAKSQPPGDLSKKSSAELVELLKNNNPWWHRTALRLLKERQDHSIAPLLKDLALHASDERHRLRGLWGLYAIGSFDAEIATKLLADADPWVRSWTIRLLGEAKQVSADILNHLVELAGSGKASEVRLQLAATAQRLQAPDTMPLIQNLMLHTEDANDSCIPLMIWLALEPRIADQTNSALNWLKDHASGNLLVTNEIIPRTMRRLVATNQPEKLAGALVFLGQVHDSAVRRRALQGLVVGLEGRQVNAPPNWKHVFRELDRDQDSEVQRLARRLAVHFRDAEAIGRSLALARDATKTQKERIDAIHDLALAHPTEALRPLEDLVAGESNLEIRSEACRALAAYEDTDLPKIILKNWNNYPPELKSEAVNLLAGRKNWAKALLAAVGDKKVPRTDLTNNVILRIGAFHDDSLNKQIETVWGKVRDTPVELNALIEQMRASLHEGPVSFEHGRAVFEAQCAKCHRFEGRGHDVGPNLDGAARDIEYLLVNILDPNRVIGQPYFIHTIERKDGRVETGILTAEDDTSVTLKNENDAVKLILKKEIEQMSVQAKSLMPEGLSKNMTVQDFRDLIRYLMVNPFLTDVAVAGPFPENNKPNINARESSASTGIKWTRPAVGPPGRIVLPASTGEGNAVAFVAAQVTSPSAISTRLQVGAVHPLQVWLNGKEVYQGKPGSTRASPDQAGVDVALTKGVNRLVFQITYHGNKEVLYARLPDPDRKLRYAEGTKRIGE
jgi:putative membrane-bound dehydrogenase-like protein